MSSGGPSLTSGLPKERLEQLYDRALERTKDLHADVWNGVRFFTGVQVIILSLVGGLAQIGTADDLRTTPIMLLLIVAFGANTLGAFTLYHHRLYYLDSLGVKAMLEELLELDSAALFRGSVRSLALPWTELASKRPQLLSEPDTWRRQAVLRWGTVTSALFLTYAGLALLDVVAIVLTSTGNL